jgi:hypothetical protein
VRDDVVLIDAANYSRRLSRRSANFRAFGQTVVDSNVSVHQCAQPTVTRLLVGLEKRVDIPRQCRVGDKLLCRPKNKEAAVARSIAATSGCARKSPS